MGGLSKAWYSNRWNQINRAISCRPLSMQGDPQLLELRPLRILMFSTDQGVRQDSSQEIKRRFKVLKIRIKSNNQKARCNSGIQTIWHSRWSMKKIRKELFLSSSNKMSWEKNYKHTISPTMAWFLSELGDKALLTQDQLQTIEKRIIQL